MKRFIWAMLLLMLSADGYAETDNGHCPGYAPGEKNVLWGDLHVHTSLSMDAYAFGTRNDPGDAFNFAKGQELTLGDHRTRVKLERPLDFTAVTDHAGFFNVLYVCTDPQFSDHEFCSAFRKHSAPPLSFSLGPIRQMRPATSAHSSRWNGRQHQTNAIGTATSFSKVKM
jgi:hypothetical protein